VNESPRSVLESTYEVTLVRELLGAYEEAKRNYLLGGHRLSAVEGGRFCEAAYRVLQSMTTLTFTPLGEMLDTERVASQLSALRAKDFPKSVRVYLPRALRIVYDIRNSRDAAHLADGIDPNLQDATLVVSVLDWVLAEFVRLSDRVSADIAQQLVASLVTRKYPVVQTFGNRPKVLRTDLRAGDVVLVLLYHVGTEGATVPELSQWVPTSMTANIRRTLRTLETKALVHQDDDSVVITRAGEKRVETESMLEIST
jgi:hypothetical protein